jgi:hypothetical protein
MRFGVQVRQESIHCPDEGVLAGRQLVQRRVLNREAALAHAALDVRDRVARRAGQSGVRLRRVKLLADRPLEPPVENTAWS